MTTAFTHSTFIPQGKNFVSSHLSRRIPHGKPSHARPPTKTRIVQAVISNEPRTSEDAARTLALEPFSWVEQWYPVMPVLDALEDEPYAFTLFDSNYVLYRVAEGRYAVLDDRCSHRLAPLSEGRVVKEPGKDEAELECAYHGWGFAGCGSCTRIPQLESGARIPKRANVGSYLTTIDAGVIWMYRGDASNAPSKPPLPKPVRDMPEDVVSSASTFMRKVPYGYEILVENLLDPEHGFWAHNGAAPMMNRKYAGSQTLVDDSDIDTHEMKNFRVAKDKKISGGFIPPCITYIMFSRPGVNAAMIFLTMPNKRSESTVFTINVAEVKNPVFRLLFNAIPRWYSHLANHNVLDGDNVFLRATQRELRDPAKWKEEYLPLETSDVFVVQFRKWMDQFRTGMPWTSEDVPLPDSPRDILLERYHSHVENCSSCMGAFKGFERAALRAEAIANACMMALTCIAVIAGTGNIALNRSTVVRTMVPILAIMLGLAVLLRRFFLKMKQEFILTDTARRLMLGP